MSETDKVFAGSIPENYDRHMVPLIFAGFAEDMARRVAALSPRAVLETAAGSGVVTRALAPKPSPDARYVVTDLNQPMLDHAATRRGADSRIDWRTADAQALLARVEVRPDERFTARYPRELSALITIYTRDKRILVKEQLGYEGGLTNPMSWDRTVEKFHWLSEPFADDDLRSRLIETVQQLDTRRISDLMDLVAQVRPTAVFPATHSGIQ